MHFRDKARPRRNLVAADLKGLPPTTIKGFATGIDVEKLVEVQRILRDEMPSETLYGGLARAGLPGKSMVVAAAE